MRQFLASLFNRVVVLPRTDKQWRQLQAAKREARAVQLRRALLASEVRAIIQRIEAQEHGH